MESFKTDEEVLREFVENLKSGSKEGYKETNIESFQNDKAAITKPKSLQGYNSNLKSTIHSNKHQDLLNKHQSLEKYNRLQQLQTLARVSNLQCRSMLSKRRTCYWSRQLMKLK